MAPEPVPRRELEESAADTPEAGGDEHAESVPVNMGTAVAAGFGWKTLTTIVSEATRIVVVVVLARLLRPHDYGVAGEAFIFAGFATLFSDLALGGALVQRRAVDEEDRSTVFWASLAFSFVVTGITVALAGFVADFFGSREVRVLLIALAFSFPLTALSTTQVALLTRQLAYRSLEVRQMAGVLAGAITAIVLAVAGFGPWAIIGNSLAGSATSTFLLWRFSSWRPSAVFSRGRLRQLGGFGIRLFGIRLLNYVNLNSDNTLIGRFAGASALGVYSLSYNIMFTPLVRIANPIGGVVYPALARMQDDLPRMREAWLRSKRGSAALLAPAFLLMAVTAPDLIRVVVGERWHAAVPVVQLLAISGVAHSLVTLNWTVLQATGRVGLEFRLDLLVTVGIVGAFAIGVHWGAVGVAASYAIVKWPVVLIDTWVTTRAMGFSLLEALSRGGSTLPLALLAAAAAYGVRSGLVSAGTPAAVRLLLAGGVGALLYLVLLRVRAPDLLDEARALFARRRPTQAFA